MSFVSQQSGSVVRANFHDEICNRTISREDLGFYTSVIVGAVYEFTKAEIDIGCAEFFFGAIKKCVEEHPALGVVVKDKHTDKPYYERVPQVNFKDHVSIIGKEATFYADLGGDDSARIEAALPSILDKPWGELPPWRIAVLPLRQTSEDLSRRSRCFIAFAFSHALGDGNIGTAFHRTFLNAILNPATPVNSTWVMTPDKELPIPFDTPQRLPISWKFLLAPLLAVLLPKSIANFFGLRATVSEVNSETWTGSKMFFDQSTFHSRPRLVEIDAAQVERALRLSRKHDARLTSLMHQLIIRALSKAIPGHEFTNFVSGTAVDMRRAIGLSKDEMGLFVNAYHGLHARPSNFALPLSEETWAQACLMTEKLAECAVSLQDQAVGLLRYVPSIRKWTAAKIGQERDCSYEVSNLGVFDVMTPLGECSERESNCKITKMVFSRPVDAVGAPLAFTMMSLKNGSLVITITWQQGALGVPIESESPLVDAICESLRQDFEQLA
ncbi:hypothetical protein UA08_04825 [Talaromyces atroroseus]|uniref:Alcohol acetyltransferase n=1 Tax=Talaromyces atroroseus TaxID=1441469 RepID=A0A225AF67_TALAT|nr:hypothetical protein UA08_04825 [Talaromyces atroroseus]OKL59952.1 hypothetical protein UA08_04825 [Talaromyces atroroseus]